MNTITKQELEKIANEAKLLKSEYIIFKGGSIIGTDQFNTYIRTTEQVDNNIEYLSFVMKDMTDLIKATKNNDIIRITDSSIILDSDTAIYTIQINDRLRDIHILEVLNRVYNIGYNDATYNLIDNEDFMIANTGRVAEGMTMIKLPFKDSFINVTVYGGYIPINKGDKLTARLYYNELSPTFNMKYEITKKKGNRQIDMFSTYLKL